MGFVSRGHLDIGDDGHLLIGRMDVVQLAKEYGTPLYIVNAERIRQNYRRFFRALHNHYPKVFICYVYKANPNLAVCKVLEREGAGAEVVSGGELYIASLVGVKPDKIVFNGVSKSLDELQMAVDLKVGLINVESIEELHRLNEISMKAGIKTPVGIRLNLDIPALTHDFISTGLQKHKFGLDVNEAFKAFETANQLDHLVFRGVHAHIGSQITEIEPFRQEVIKLLDFVGLLKNKLGVDIECIDLGGGLGIKYGETSRALTPEEYATAIIPVVRDKINEYGLNEPTLISEPGRYLVADSSILVSQVNYVKKVGDVSWALIDAGMNDFLRPALYRAQHRMVVANKALREPAQTYNVGGPICESADVFGDNQMFPEIENGDILALLDAGAYGFSMSSQYNSRPRAAMVMVDNGIVKVVRRRETYEDLVACDIFTE
ncbi:MAG: Diaminopimelate decarboxylase [Candidatus Bathyarchaeota archaeon BA1]|nr:MAG: Diaminopimelate decarboxylase [Candidatus Bathyarchaeota archaeon BA1]